MATRVTIEALSGGQLRDMFAAAAAWLEKHTESVNAINVFPVPDGDTGTNMYLTMRSVMEEAQRCPEEGAGAIMAAMSQGALMGARGNSGVILSQIIRGMTRAVGEAESVDAATWVRGMEEGAVGAYKAVTKPAEGTILTVMREASEAARQTFDSEAPDILGVMEATLEAASQSLERTPTLLPVLAEAGVVDAGGKGLLVLLDGMTRHLKGEPMDVAAGVPEEQVGQEWLAVTSQLHGQEESLYGYCTEFLIGGKEMEPDSVRNRMLELGDSVLVVGDDRLVRVHVHTDDPGAALSHGTGVGSLLQVKVDNIREQADRFLEMHEGRAEVEAQPEAISTVAVAAGEGMATVFRSVGCTKVVSGGPTMNPSTRDILDAVEACSSDDVILLPNDKNIIMAAKQAEELTQKRLRVVGTRSIPQGIAALLALNQDAELEANVTAMEEAGQGVLTLEVCRAVRSTSIGGVKVREGQIIAIVDDELKLAAETAEEGVLRALEGVEAEGVSLVTLYYGADTKQAEAESLGKRVKQAFPQYDVEVVHGGQPHYNYIASVE
ncbi:MAG: DAK2 domain-containing protein [Chloroflexi bacterium]|nr:DAK2 domain-containing protein [Chloroflexota bacterium]